MGSSDQESHRPWLAFALEDSLKRSLYSPKDILVHASPEVLVAQLPHQVISEILTRALSSGSFSAAAVIETAPPALLSEYLPPELIWSCLRDVADRGGLSKKGATRTASSKQWLAGVLQRALETELITPADVLRFIPPGEFVGTAPLAVVAELIKNGLTRGSFDPALVLQYLTPAVIAESLETALAWGCISEAVARRFELEVTTVGPSPAVMASSLMERTPAPIVAPAPKSKNANGSSSGRIEGTLPRPPAAPPAKSVPASASASASVTPAPVSASTLPAEWKSVDDLDLLEEETLPPRPAAKG